MAEERQTSVKGEKTIYYVYHILPYYIIPQAIANLLNFWGGLHI